MSVIRRSLLRSGIRLKYSEGFNPHPYISIALPLPIGCGSVCELLDFGTADSLLPDGLPEIINESLPEGLHVLEAYAPARKLSNIAWLELNAAFTYDYGLPPNAADMITECFLAKSIIITKKTKRGEADIDIAPHIRDMLFDVNEQMLKIKVSAQNPTINHENLLSALDGKFRSVRPDFAQFTRIETYDGDMGVFR